MTSAGPRQAGDAAASLRKDAVPQPPAFQRILVANRGEIAVRIIRAAQELGIETVAVYSDADAEAVHVRAADVAVRLGPAPASESYLRADAIVDAAVAAGADAVHPGYGFLAERASFAEAVERSGLVFIGPTPATIARLGDKLAARRLARNAGVPVVPGTLEPAAVDRPDAVEGVMADAEGIGFPLFVKAAAGGGGRGMRRVERAADLVAALAAGSAEAASAFGDGAVYLEREIRPARHVEVQLVGDTAGTIVALGERDCSIQRRHQKLVEESPAPGLSEEARRILHELAVRVGRAAGLRSVATAEFLLDNDRRFWFLEVNTRLQVEHGVTELVAGVDLVQAQILIAAGEPLADDLLAAAEAATHPRRHAIEVRLSAEDPARGFVPTPGRIGRWSMPSGPGVRVDVGVEAGDRVPPDYDALVAKLLVVAPDRARAIARLTRALDEVEITGIQTTLPFHRHVARHRGFRAGDLSTDWVATEWDPIAGGARSDALAAAGPVAAAAAAGRVAAASTQPGVGPRIAAPRPGPKPQSGRRGLGWREAGRLAAVDRWPR